MKCMKLRNRVFCIFSVMMAILFGAQTLTFAASQARIDPKMNVSLRIVCDYNGDPVANEEFSVYKVASISTDWKITVEDNFKRYPVDFSKLKNEDEWQDIAEVLRNYAIRAQLDPDCTGETDENGELQFSQADDEITRGIYLVSEKKLIVDDDYYKVLPFLIELPEKSNSGDNEYEVVVEPKEFYDVVPDSVDVDVAKAWDDETAQSYRPDSIEVELLKDGELYDTQELSENNNWRYTWEGLDGEPEWIVVEKDVADNYTVTSETNDTSVTITNTIDPSTRDTSSSNKTTTSSSSSSSGKLPQTGQLWWPVPVLSATGLFLIVIGIAYEEKKREV